MDALEDFIIRAKAATYVGGGASAPASRSASHDLAFELGEFRYLDSYFGGTDFAGQEVVWHLGQPVWSMAYHGRILRDDLIDGAAAGATIKAALTALYGEGRFLGGFRFRHEQHDYIDIVDGDYRAFFGYEEIRVRDTRAYALRYFGGLIRD
jgi:hypothetical protein